MSQQLHPSTTSKSISSPIPPWLSEQIDAANSVEEVKSIMSAAFQNQLLFATKNTDQHETMQVYWQLQRECQIPDDIVVTRQEAAEKCSVRHGNIYYWEKRGWVRVVEKAKRRGMHTSVRLRDVYIMAELTKRCRTGRSGPLKGFSPPIEQQLAS